MIFGAIAIFLRVGPHVWSIYQPYDDGTGRLSQTAASMCFYLALSTFVFGNIIGEDYRINIIRRLLYGSEAGSSPLNSGIRIPDRTPFVASGVCVTYGVMQGFGQGLILYRNYLDCSEMVPGKNGIRIRCGRNGKRTVWILFWHQSAEESCRQRDRERHS